jgi:hypothetical protein
MRPRGGQHPPAKGHPPRSRGKGQVSEGSPSENREYPDQRDLGLSEPLPVSGKLWPETTGHASPTARRLENEP